MSGRAVCIFDQWDACVACPFFLREATPAGQHTGRVKKSAAVRQCRGRTARASQRHRLSDLAPTLCSAPSIGYCDAQGGLTNGSQMQCAARLLLPAFRTSGGRDARSESGQ